MDLTAHELVRLLHLLLLLAVIFLFRWVFKRPIHRLFDWKYFRSKKSHKR
jgi:flagellar biogenesis protein FliO